LSLEKKLYTQVILQTVVHTSCTYKLCAYQTYTQKFSDKILYLEVMHQSCVYKLWFFRNENLLEEKLKECLEVGVDRSLATILATGR
jgi:hypothetical protein